MSSSKRHFIAVIGSKEHGLYISASLSSAAKKIVSKLCASSKSKKVEFCVREITQGSKKKTYGPYLGEMKNNKVIVHLKKDKLNKIIKGGRVERFGIIELTDFIQRKSNNSQFAVIRKNYFRKPYLFFSPTTNPLSGTTYYKYIAYEMFLFRKPIIKQIKKNNIEDVDDIMQIDLNTLEKLQKFIEQNNIFSKLNEKIKIIIKEKKDAINKLQNKKNISRLQNRIVKKQKQKQQANITSQQPANITPQQANASAKQQAPQPQKESQEIIFSNNSINNKIIETTTEIQLDSNESN